MKFIEILRVLLPILILSSPSYVLAQTPDTEAKVKIVPKVTYPAEASKTGLDGEVRVVVDIDLMGKVTLAYDATGPGSVCDTNRRDDVVAMRHIALKAARTSCLLSGDVWRNARSIKDATEI